MVEKPKNAYLIRLGARAVEEDPLSGLLEEGAGGRNYIKRLVEGEWSTLPFERVFYARMFSPLARETTEAIVEAARNCVWTDEKNHPIEERPELYPEEKSLPGWQALSSRMPRKATLEDLKRSVGACVKEGLVPEDFLDQEVTRTFGFIERETLSIPEGESILCLMPSPIPEAIMLWLHKKRPHRTLQKQRPLSAIRILSYLDGFRLIFEGGKLTHSLKINNQKRVRQLVLNDVWEQKLITPDSKEGRALAEYGLPLLVKEEDK